MPEYETIIVDVSPTGKVMIKTEGFTGKACLAATLELEASLGKVTNTTPTAEMNHVQEEVKNAAKRKQ